MPRPSRHRAAPDGDPAAVPTEQGYRVDDLARVAGTTVRNVRVYSDRGLLPPPRLVGRVGWYGEEHVARLRLITRLLERGYTLAAIGDLVTSWQSGRALADVLGLEDLITQPWTDEPAGRTSVVELRRMFGREATPAAVRRATELGLVVRDRGGLRVPSPRLLDAGAALVDAGISLVAVLDLAEAVQRDLADVARRFVDVVTGQLAPGAATGNLPAADELSRVVPVVERLRPQASKIVESIFAAAMEDEVTRAFGDVLARARRASERAGIGPGPVPDLA